MTEWRELKDVCRAVAHSTAQSKPLGAEPENVAGKEAASEPTQPVPETHTPSRLTQLCITGGFWRLERGL